MSPKTISVIFVCDDHYAIMLAALIKSIEQNHHTSEKIDFYIVDDHISRASKEKLIKTVTDPGISFYWVPIKDAIPKGVKIPLVRNSYPLNIIVRIFIPEILSKELKRVIYLDVDMIMLEDVSKLWHVDLKGKPVGAVQDPKTRCIENNIQNYRELNLEPRAPYLNSGVLVYDVERYLSEKISEKAMNCISQNPRYARLIDQYGLNVALCGNWEPLDPEWNHFSDDDQGNPYLIHYAWRKPFYKTYKNHFYDIWQKYLQQTPWKEAKPVGELLRLTKKMGNVFQKFRLFFK